MIDLDRPAVDAAVLVDAVDRHLQADQRGLAAGSAGARERLLRADLVGLGLAECRAAMAPAPASSRRARRRPQPTTRAARHLAAVPEVLRPLFFFPLFSHRESSLWISLAPIATRACGAVCKRHLNLEKRQFRPHAAARQASSAAAERVTARPCRTARRGIASPPLPALGGLFIPISKRDPNKFQPQFSY